MNYRPVFISGCDRSGTTLLGDMLGTSPWAVTTPESQFIHDLMIQIKLASFESAEAAAAWMLNHFRFAAWTVPLHLDELTSLMDLENPRKTIENLVASYTRTKHPDKLDADVWIDHTPDSFKFHPILKSLFPDARFIHIVRDGRAVTASITGLDWGPNNAYMAARHWAARLQEALSVEVAEGKNCLRLHFEDLVTRPTETLAQVCEYIDIPFDEAMRRGGGLVLPGFTRGQHSLVGRPPQASRVDKWREKLSVAEVRDFENYPLAHTLLARMGYQPRFNKPPRLSTLYVLGRYCHEFLHYVLHRLQHRRMECQVISDHQDFLNNHSGRVNLRQDGRIEDVNAGGQKVVVATR